MIIACVNQKGGVGKTTLAVHLACWLQREGRRVALLDCDTQTTASRWLKRMPDAVTAVQVHEVDDIIESAMELQREHGVIVVDGAASLADSTRALLLIADLAVLPCGATVPELEASAATVRMLQNARRVRGGHLPAGILVLTRLRHRGCRLVREAPVAAASLGLPVAKANLTLREATADAPGQGTTVWHLGRRAQPAASEMTSLCQEILRYAQSTTDNTRDADCGAASIPELVITADAC